MTRRSLIAVGTIMCLLPSAPAQAAPPAPDTPDRFQSSTHAGRLSPSYTPRSVSATGTVNVIVELAGDPVAVVRAEKGRDLTKAERSAVTSDLTKAQSTLSSRLKASGATVQATMQSAYNGIQATVPAAELTTIEKLPGVVGVHEVPRYTRATTTSVPYLGVPKVWQNTGYTGRNVKVAIIDSGVDYTHASFGGPGTTSAFEQAWKGSDQAANPAWFGPGAPRVKGGYDFVGDAYTGDNTPVPDPNPLDCDGHGTHVAATAAGGGVTTSGKPFTGPYNATTATKAFRVGPGVAPRADLYALRVLGCTGGTEVTTQAIDWAVANGMDVINMSLGAPYGRADDPTSVAASNAVGAGIVVVASSGNEGPSPYLTGAPGNADGVISVAAVDSAKTFPAARIRLSGSTLTAINANGAALPTRALTVVSLTDNPDTEENEAVGCSEAAFAAAGVSPGSNQLAVTERGVCGRAAKAIFGQRAGAAAVVMVNDTDDYPPFEGPISANPDDPSDTATVSIPFLGLRSSEGPALLAAGRSTTTLSATTVGNPGFGGYGAFSSSGPRNGDSAISPNLAAPGVSIFSAAVGTGSQGRYQSGTSMAAPHVAGVVALSAEAHPSWSAQDLAASVTSTADPDKVVGQSVSRGGLGLVDAAQAVATTVTVTGDPFRTDSGRLREAALSFGFAESWAGFAKVRSLAVTNHGSKAVTYTVTSRASAQSRPAKLTFSAKKVTIKPGKTVRIKVALTAKASTAGSSVGASDQFAFQEISGSVVLTPTSGAAAALRVPYLLVPRASSRVQATWDGHSTTLALSGSKRPKTPTIALRNPLGALAGTADVYTWGLSDGRDVPKGAPGSGYDLRAAGVQSFEFGDDRFLVFGIATHSRWSNAASNEFDVMIDTNADGEADWILFSSDSGLVTTGEASGVAEVFLYQPSSGALGATGYLAVAPTDSSTIAIPVPASMLGLTADSGAFSYRVVSYSLEDSTGTDEMPGAASYDPWRPALANGQYLNVPRNGRASVPVPVDAAAFKAQRPLGVMVISPDNASGAGEAALLRVR